MARRLIVNLNLDPELLEHGRPEGNEPADPGILQHEDVLALELLAQDGERLAPEPENAATSQEIPGQGAIVEPGETADAQDLVVQLHDPPGLEVAVGVVRRRLQQPPGRSCTEFGEHAREDRGAAPVGAKNDHGTGSFAHAQLSSARLVLGGCKRTRPRSMHQDSLWVALAAAPSALLPADVLLK